MKRNLTLILVAAAMLMLAAGPAMAGAFRIPEASATALGQGNAFVGQADEPSAVHFNPAAITGLEGIQIQAGVIQVSPESEFEGESAKDQTFYPPFVFYANQISDSDWFLGFGVSAPFGLGTEWEDNVSFNNPLAWGSPWVTETTLEIAKIAPVVAYKVSDQFSIGIGPEYYDVQNVVYAGGATAVPSTVNFTYSMEGDGDGLGYVLSGLYQATDSLRVGFTWHSGVTAELKGDAIRLPTAGLPYSGKASLDLNLPDTMALGFHYVISDAFTVNLDLDQTMWSDYDKLEFKDSGGSIIRTINKDYDDVLAIRVGGQYKLNEKWTLRAGFHTEPTPVIEETFDPRLPDADATSITIGAGYDVGSYAINFAYMALSKDDRTVDTDEPSPLLPIFDGEYKSSVDLISVDAIFRF
jgi:long-chain fatty acid transport protein